MIARTIKEHTAEAHRTLEEHPTLRPLQAESISKDEYVAILDKFYGYYEPLESLIFRQLSGNDCAQLSVRRRAHLLKQDLERIGAGTQPQLCSMMPSIGNPAEAFGALYVLEGSSLGSRIIYRNISKAGYTREHGAEYFYGYGEQTGDMWKGFLESMQAHEAQHGGGEAMMATARATFDGFYQWLNQQQAS